MSSRSLKWLGPLGTALAADAEGDRLAGDHLAGLLDDAGRAEVNELLAQGKFTAAVRRVRALTGLRRLIDTKRVAESLQRQLGQPGGS